ncbi:Uncharacterized protein TCM_038463 [Theobroma cacao]|uniref:Uncharacterized protein n=1 Tax=Theobroma cacao TaxID=3641 RepID=A0A061GQV3_THECC|nr:Uncharacterized protein TCM_038463 [Theobroma cacao]
MPCLHVTTLMHLVCNKSIEYGMIRNMFFDVPYVRLVITHDGHWVNETYKSEDDWCDEADISNCNHVEGNTKHVRGIDFGDVQCDDPIYNSPIINDNGIRSLETLPR